MKTEFRAARIRGNFFKTGQSEPYPCFLNRKYYRNMSNDNSENSSSAELKTDAPKKRKKKVNIEEVIRKRIDEAIISDDDKSAKLHLEILEKYNKNIKPAEQTKKQDYKTRRAERDKLMAMLLEKFKRIKEASEIEAARQKQINAISLPENKDLSLKQIADKVRNLRGDQTEQE